MSLCPSNLMAKNANPGKIVFPNMARRKPVDEETISLVNAACLLELASAGIEAEGPASWLADKSEVPFHYLGNLHLWSFRRAWYYWIAKGPGIPADKAQAFHEIWGTQVRVDGHCGCPSPLEWFKGFSVGHYHIDTQEGLNAFADLLRSIYKPGDEK
jgi:hypothetical protein